MLPMNKQATDYINGYKPHPLLVELTHAVTSLRFGKEFDFADRRVFVQITEWVLATSNIMEEFAERTLAMAKAGLGKGEVVELSSHTISDVDDGFRLEIQDQSIIANEWPILEQFATIEHIICELHDPENYGRKALDGNGHLKHAKYDSI